MNAAKIPAFSFEATSKKTAWLLVAALFFVSVSSVATASDAANGLCEGEPTIPGPLYLDFDASYHLYATQFHLGPDGHTYVFEQHGVTAAEVAMLCAGGQDVRARGAGDFFPLAIEYYAAASDHYFMAADPTEIAGLDGGQHPGWVRTGQQFRIYFEDPSSPSGQFPLSPVCRFYGLPEFGLDTHFFSAFQPECAAVSDNWPDRWLLETSFAFAVHLPDSSGTCPANTVPLYRLYNDRADANHRYTTSLSIRQQMIDRSWISEGYGALGVAMCVRQA